MAPPQPHEGTQPNARAGRSRADVALAERLMAAARTGADVRTRKVRRLRAAIKVRAYENDLKLAVAVANMLAAVREAAPETRNPKREIRNKLRIPKKK
jgi:hypothetical protein